MIYLTGTPKQLLREMFDLDCYFDMNNDADSLDALLRLAYTNNAAFKITGDTGDAINTYGIVTQYTVEVIRRDNVHLVSVRGYSLGEAVARAVIKLASRLQADVPPL